MTASGGGSPTRTARPGASNAPSVPGVVETIANGLSLVLLYPILVAVPLALDAVAWAGLRISPSALAADSATAADLFDGLGLRDDLTRLVGLYVPTLITWVDRDRFFTLTGGTT